MHVSWWKRLFKLRLLLKRKAAIRVTPVALLTFQQDTLAYPPQRSERSIADCQFATTISPGAPLKVLWHDAHILSDLVSEPLHLTGERSQAISKTNAFHDFGCDIDGLKLTRSLDTPVGRVQATQFLPFLIACQEIVQGGGAPHEQRAAVECLRSNAQWSEWLDKL